MQLKPRKPQATKSQRVTRRRRLQKQRGGANPAESIAAIVVDRKDKWIAKLTAELPTVAPYFTADAKSQEFADAWIAAVENQDAVLTMALDLFKENAAVKLATDYSNADAFAASTENRGLLTAYIQDAVRIIQYTPSTASAGDKTKIEYLLDPATSLLHIALFPKFMTNTFIQSLAGIFYRMKTNGEEYTANILLKSEKLTELLVDQFNKNVKVMAMHLASSEPLDGFFLDQSAGDFAAALPTFFSEMLKALKSLLTVTDVNELFRPPTPTANCPHDITAFSWPEVSAHALRHYMIKESLDNLFARFGACEGDITNPETIKYIPDSVLAPEIVYETAPVKSIILSMGAETFQFMLHLRAVLRQIEAEQARASSLESAAPAGT